MIEGVHFDLAYTNPRELGHKALAVAMSDIAAIAAKPLFANLSVGVRQETSEPFLMELQGGVDALAKRYGLGVGPLSTVQSPTALIVNTTIIASVGKEIPTDNGARPGDLIAITGHVGTSAAGLACLKRLGRHALGYQESILQAQLRPEPRTDEARALFQTGGVTAMILLSDGLATDLHEITSESGVGALVEEAHVPISAAAIRAGALINSQPKAWALYGGEDFELLVTLSPKTLKRAQAALKKLDCPLTVVGEIRPRRDGVQLLLSSGECVPLQPRLWNHFVRRRRTATR